MLCLELGKIIDVFIDDDPEVVSFLVRRNGTGREGLGHGDYVDRQQEEEFDEEGERRSRRAGKLLAWRSRGSWSALADSRECMRFHMSISTVYRGPTLPFAFAGTGCDR